VLSFRNEEKVIPELIRRLSRVLGEVSINYELIFVNDASTDSSLQILEQESGTDPHIRIITMSRVFGVAECIVAGLAHASGDAVIYMDSDLQDPPEIIPELVEKWRAGADVVYTVRTARDGEHPLRQICTKLAYRVIRGFTSEVNLTVEAGDFKLLSRRVVSELLKLEEKDPYLRGLVPWLGFKQVPVYYKRHPRAAGETHFPVFRNFFKDLLTFKGGAGTFAIAITSFSMLPVVLLLVFGVLVSSLSLLALVLTIVLKCFGVVLPPSSGLMIAIFFMSGIQLLGLGIIGLYIARIYREARNRPRYIIEDKQGFQGKGT